MGTINPYVNPTGRLVCESLELMCPGWSVLDDISVLIAPAKLRGDYRIIGDQRGRVPQPQQVDSASFEFRFPIAGDRNMAGEYYENPMAGYYSNINTLRTITDPVPVLVDELGCREMTFHFPDDVFDPITQPVQLALDLKGVMLGPARDSSGRISVYKRATLTIAMPYGFFG